MRMYEDDYYDDEPTLIEQLIEEKRRKGLLPKTSYTREEVVAMLTELKNELTDISWNIDMYDSDLDFECCYLSDIDKFIQQKINSLKGE